MTEVVEQHSVHGYRAPSAECITIVNYLKMVEEGLLRLIDKMRAEEDVDPRWSVIGRMQIEQGFMALNRSVCKPERVKLPGDDEAAV